MNLAEKVKRIGLPLVAVALLIIAFLRLFYGISFSDEAYYVAGPYRFILGDRPFVDDRSIEEFFLILMTPLVGAAHWLLGGVTGIILTLRTVYFLLTLLTATLIYSECRQYVSRGSAAALAISPVLFIPWSIPTFSYNSICCLAFSASFFLTARYVRTRRPAHLLAIGALHAVGVFAIPGCVVTVPAFAVGYIFLAPAGEKKRIFWYLSGGLIIIAAYAGYLSHILTASDDTLRMYLHTATHAINPLNCAVKMFFSSFRNFSGLPLAIALLICLYHRWRILFWGLSLLVFPATWMDVLEANTSLIWVRDFAVFGAIFLFALPRGTMRRLCMLGWGGGYLVGTMVSWGSTNGVNNAGVGLFLGAMIISLSVLTMLEREPSHRVVRVVRGAWIIFWIITLSVYQWTIYEDASVLALTRRVKSGPFLGLLTTQERAVFVDELYAQLSRLEPGGRIVYYDHFPGGYLFSRHRPAVWDMWGSSFASNKAYLLESAKRYPNDRIFLVRIRYPMEVFPSKVNPVHDSSLDQWARTNGTLLADTARFEIYRLNR